MSGVPEIYTVLEWYRIDNELITFRCENRRDNPDPTSGPAYFDFPSLSILRYAGEGLFSSEEDFWDVWGARRTAAKYAAACERADVSDVDRRLTRKHWPSEPAWAAGPEVAEPSWRDRSSEPLITKPRELYALLGRERWVDARGAK